MQLTYDKVEEDLTQQECEILSTLLYFNIFSHPLLEEEIFTYSMVSKDNQSKVNYILGELVAKQMLFYFDGYYSVQNKPEWVVKRKHGNELAKSMLNRAKIVSRFISWFPFVRGVFITGSLSKNYMDKNADIDYLVATAQNRLWLCRSLIAIFKKCMVGPLKKYFCINYYLSEDNLGIKDRNLFTATEIAFVYPTYNAHMYKRMMDSNKWIQAFYPNKTHFTGSIHSNTYPFSVKRAVEYILSNSIGDRLDNFLCELMKKRWDKRYRQTFSSDEKQVNIRTQKNESKQHERGHQFIILHKFQEQIKSFEKKHQVKLTNDRYTSNA